MRRSLPFHPPLGGSPSAPDAPTVGDLYAAHWRYVRSLLLSYGVCAQDVGDVAQTVWLHVHRRWHSYSASKHPTQRAWITGFVARCAANHRRTQRRRGLILIEDPGALLLAPDLDPEHAALLRDIHRLVPNEDQRIALLLQVRHGLSIAEIAAVQNVTESAVEWRLSMARKELSRGGNEKKRRGAFLGFGSLEALAEALKPKPIPDEVGEAQWKRIQELIRQEEASPRDEEGDPESEEGPPGDARPPLSSPPPAAALPAAVSLPGTASTLGAAKVAGLVVLAFVAGSGGLVHGAGCREQPLPAMEATSPFSPVTTSAAPPLPPNSTAPSSAEVVATAHSAAPSSTTAATGAATSTAALPAATGAKATITGASTSAPAMSSEVESLRMLAQMREAMMARRFSVVIDLAEKHARELGAVHVRTREALRIEALRQTGRIADAAQHARAMITSHPEHRNAFERAAGQALP